MLESRLDWVRLVLCVLISICSLFGRLGKVVAQDADGEFPNVQYVGADFCAACHEDEGMEWYGHGHAWMQVHTGGQVPPDDLFAPLGYPLPTLPAGVTWDQVQDIVGHFKDGAGSVLTSDGKLYEPDGRVVNPMPGRCNKCHNTAGTATGNMYGTAIQGTWKLNGIQCEQCHGPGPTMEVPDGQICRDCHSSGDTGAHGFRSRQGRIPDTFRSGGGALREPPSRRR